jgi:O-succinylbenzoate synthase
MEYKFAFRPYQRQFRIPIKTSHGTWDLRKGIILRLTDDKGKEGFGEIAPVSWLGSETFDQALDFCQKLPKVITPANIFSIPDELPACQFGIESAWEAITTQTMTLSGIPLEDLPDFTSEPEMCSGLLPAGQAAILARKILWKKGYRTFKWKIGVMPIELELRILEQLVKSIMEELPSDESISLRLDANGGLTDLEASQWLHVCDKAGKIIEFLEQPLPVDQLEKMQKLSDRFSTPIALDESVVTLKQMKEVYHQGWNGIFVIKPSIAGSPSQIRQFCKSKDIDAVFSSVFETEIGRDAALRLASELNTKHNRPVGFGVSQWFDDRFDVHQLWHDYLA